MKKIALTLLTALTVSVLAGCSGSGAPAESTAAGTEAAESMAAAEDAEETTAGAEGGDAEVSADNPFNGKTVKVGCSSTFVPFESIEMDAKGNKTYVGMNIDIVTEVVEKNGGTVEFQDMPFKSLTAAIQAGQIDFCSGGMAPTEERKKTLDFSEIFF